MTFEVVHDTQYEYTDQVSVSHHLARLAPRTLPRQRCLQHDLQIEPVPDVVTTHADYFGNGTTFFIMQSAHRRLTIRARSRVDVDAFEPPPSSAIPPWERAADRSAMPLEAIECAVEALPTRLRAALIGYAQPSFAPGRGLLDAVKELTARIHADFVYDQTATTIETPLIQVFESRRGVCQDFARLEIACLRVMGLAARYVSGYLETMPAPGSPRLVGADASHAWLAVHCPDVGWIDVDPTNDVLPSDRHITLAWGRDYGDVSPIRGVILGGGEHSLQVSVEVSRRAVLSS